MCDQISSSGLSCVFDGEHSVHGSFDGDLTPVTMEYMEKTRQELEGMALEEMRKYLTGDGYEF